MPKATVIISVYNKLDFLAKVLAGFERQTERDFEIILADDGSGPAFTEALPALMNAAGIPWQHCWHEDAGFRKNKILNEAIRRAGADYLIFVDGDCIPHRAFVEEHLRHRAEGVALAGRRLNLPAGLSERLTPAAIRAGRAERFHLDYLPALLQKDSMIPKGWYTRNRWVLAWANRKPKGIVGCNFSLHRADMLRINGFDERYTQPTIGEDTDVEYRLGLAGVVVKPVLHLAVQYHLHHKLLPRPQANLDLFAQVQQEARAFTPYGIEQ